MQRYKLEDLDVDAFARQWLKGLEAEDARMRSLVEKKPHMGPFFMMANIGPRAVELAASSEELVLFAVLSAFQSAEELGRRPKGPWEGTTAHLDAAFDYANEIGRGGVAASLLESVVRQGKDEDGFSQRLTAEALHNDPGSIAAHEQEMAHLLHREIRAAKLLDPALSVDTFLLGDSTDG